MLGQSQPRISRHLKLLGETGLLERFREQHFMYYRVPADGPGGELVHQLLALVDPRDPTFLRDRERSRSIHAERSGEVGAAAPGAQESGSAEAPERDLADLLAAEIGPGGRDSLLYVGQAPAAVLATIGSRHGA